MIFRCSVSRIYDGHRWSKWSFLGILKANLRILVINGILDMITWSFRIPTFFAQNKSKMRRNQVAVPNRTPLECQKSQRFSFRSTQNPTTDLGSCKGQVPSSKHAGQVVLRNHAPQNQEAPAVWWRTAGAPVFGLSKVKQPLILLGVYCLHLFFEWNHLTVPWANQVFWRSFVHRFIGNQPSHQLNAHHITMSTTQIVH